MKFAVENFINEALSNVLNDVCCATRVAAYVKDNKLICYLHGGKRFIYDYEEDEIIVDNIKINTLAIHSWKARKIYEKIVNNSDDSKQEEINKTKEKYGITKKRIGEKERRDIAKYEASLKTGIGST